MPLTPQTPVEVVLDEHPAAADWLLQRGVICLRCGEPFWGSLGELLRNKRYTDEETARLVDELNAHLAEAEG
ncbi:MAG: DUF1858 domain-containing protein [Candidatus Coatesbacteria bacterium]|nr:DUF1858 domain-containing protein [Candidatus Coatesbacteria bacterium]